MSPDLVAVIVGTGSVMAAGGGIALKITSGWIGAMREDIKSVQNLDVEVGAHKTELAELNRRLSQLEGGMSAKLDGIDNRMLDIRERMIRLEAAIDFKREVQGMIGNRMTDRKL